MYIHIVCVCVCVCVCMFSCVQLFCDPMDCSLLVASVHGIFQTGILGRALPFPSPGDLPDPGLQPLSLVSPASAGRYFFPHCTTWEAHLYRENTHSSLFPNVIGNI